MKYIFMHWKRFSLFAVVVFSRGLLAEAPAEDAPTADKGRFMVSVNGQVLTEEMAVERIRENIPDHARVDLQQLKTMCRRFAPAIAAEYVGQVLLKSEARRANIRVPESKVDDVFRTYKSKHPNDDQFDAVLKKHGLTETSLRRKIREELLIPTLLENKFGDTIQPDESELKAHYQAEKDKYDLPETVSARHILLKFEGVLSAEQKAKLKNTAEQIRLQLVDGADFAALAQKYSDCPSKNYGGALTPFPQGRMVKEFDQVAFQLKPGQISDVVETKFGYHIIEVTGHDPGGQKSFEEVKDTIARELEKEKRQEATQAFLEKLKAKADIEYADFARPKSD